MDKNRGKKTSEFAWQSLSQDSKGIYRTRGVCFLETEEKNVDLNPTFFVTDQLCDLELVTKVLLASFSSTHKMSIHSCAACKMVPHTVCALKTRVPFTQSILFLLLSQAADLINHVTFQNSQI